MVCGEEFYFKLKLPARYLTLKMQLRTDCLPISARFKIYSKERCSNGDRYTCPLCRDKDNYLTHCLSWCQGLSTIREGKLENNELILPGVWYVASVYL